MKYIIIIFCVVISSCYHPRIRLRGIIFDYDVHDSIQFTYLGGIGVLSTLHLDSTGNYDYWLFWRSIAIPKCIYIIKNEEIHYVFTLRVHYKDSKKRYYLIEDIRTDEKYILTKKSRPLVLNINLDNKNKDYFSKYPVCNVGERVLSE
jgi:hypothetical protein